MLVLGGWGAFVLEPVGGITAVLSFRGSVPVRMIVALGALRRHASTGDRRPRTISTQKLHVPSNGDIPSGRSPLSFRLVVRGSVPIERDVKDAAHAAQAYGPWVLDARVGARIQKRVGAMVQSVSGGDFRESHARPRSR